jgi:hypothetical protein
MSETPRIPVAHSLERILRPGAGAATALLCTRDEARATEIVEEVADRLGLELSSWSSAQGPIGPWIAGLDEDEGRLWIVFDIAEAARSPSERRAVREVAQRSAGAPVVFVQRSTGWLASIPELEPETLPAPGREELRYRLESVQRRLVRGRPGLSIGDPDVLASAALGLERTAIDRVIAQVLTDPTLGDELHSRLHAAFVESKSRVGSAGGILERVESRPRAELGGLGAFKSWLERRRLALSGAARDAGIPHPRGVLLAGVQGCGKSLAARVCADMLGLPLFRLDPGRVFGGTVGESEANLRGVLASVDAMAPVALWLDEVDKGLAGGESTNSDGGTTARVVGTLLTWLQERRRPVFVVATANRVERLPPELTRRGRLDELFFVDLPDADVRARILDIHLRVRPERELGRVPPLGDEPAEFMAAARAADGFSGAELEAALIEARLEALSRGEPLRAADLQRALAATVPLSRARREEIERLRRWAHERARSA